MTKEEAVSIIKKRISMTEYVESNYVDCVDIEALKMAIEALRQPEIIMCKDCIHFHYDFPYIYVTQAVPVFIHEVCDFWGDGCKTSENAYCSHAERGKR